MQNVTFAQWKYLGFLTVPLVGFVSLYGEGAWTYGIVFYAFGLVPLLELWFKPSTANLNEEQLKRFKSNPFFNRLVFSVVPLYVILLSLFLTRLSTTDLTPLEYSGVVISFGIVCGVIAINIGHELGHRHNQFERTLGEILLVLALQAHFLPYHNHGHHRNVATPVDPATARRNEPIYLFWFRSQIGSYLSAWRIEYRRLTNKQRNPFSFGNRMIRYTVMEATIVFMIYQWFGLETLIAYFLICFIGMLLLETVNYIEHYGLLRKKISADKYERVSPKHSWNSDHLLGRILLFELSRHSDHHANPTKPYQCLESYQESPQMPTGYPGMMLLSLLPPLWFRVMNRKLATLEK
ncbi:alkane 1-monooxygenase [Aliikangiella marina]|uniref:Alkane 1-monooxygenase n=1 Tax=Aliikangiella marina TaxID=1712262 RepID=A0A545TD85_9GAMM|nr:alkane 1-monooxygenase [Aliikangiella marina]TQV75182.1 alkane 1-monooxygenase [Aliikangiella marina]